MSFRCVKFTGTKIRHNAPAGQGCPESCHGFLDLSGSVAHELSAFSALSEKLFSNQGGPLGGRFKRPFSSSQ
jgi:hypothetical protein